MLAVNMADSREETTIAHLIHLQCARAGSVAVTFRSKVLSIAT